MKQWSTSTVAALLVVFPIPSQTQKRPEFEWHPSGFRIHLQPSGSTGVLHLQGRSQGCEGECRDLVSGGPGWMDSIRFNIEARAPQAQNLDHTTVDQRGAYKNQLLRHRLQALLEGRFRLAVRREAKAGLTY